MGGAEGGQGMRRLIPLAMLSPVKKFMALAIFTAAGFFLGAAFGWWSCG